MAELYEEHGEPLEAFEGETAARAEEATPSEVPAAPEGPTAETPPPEAGKAGTTTQAYEPSGQPPERSVTEAPFRWPERLREISLGTWLVASVLGLLTLILLVALLAFIGIRGSRRAAQEVAANADTQVRQLQAQIDTLKRDLEALQAAHTELQRSLEDRLSGELQTLRQDFQKADQQLADEVQQTLDAQGQELRREIQASLEELSQEVRTGIARTRLEVLLLRASRQALQARIHLAEKKPGLAKRDLRAVEALLNDAAQATDDAELQAALGNLRDSIRELREGIEAQTFPITTVEVLIEKIDEVLQTIVGAK